MTATIGYDTVTITQPTSSESLWSKISTPFVNAAHSVKEKVSGFAERHPSISQFTQATAIMFYWTFVTVFITVVALVSALVAVDWLAQAIGLQ